MRRFPSSWTDTLAKLGFRRTRKRNSSRFNRYQRRLAIEGLEPRQMLSITVDSLEDNTTAGDGLTTLREAIQLANDDSDADTIDFAPSLTASGPATLSVSLGQFDEISHDLTIDGPGAHLLTLDAHDNSRFFYLGNGGIIDVTIRGLTLTGGYAANEDVNGNGGAISGTIASLVLEDVILEGNSADNYGGAVATASQILVIRDSTVQDNVARWGGGINRYNSIGAQLTIERSVLARNHAVREAGGGVGGGIYISGTPSAGTVSIVDSTFDANIADLWGGGICQQRGTLEVVGSTFTGNQARPGDLPTSGGGLFLHGDLETGISVVIENTTIAHNSANFGGGIEIRKPAGSQPVTVDIVNSTITDNEAVWASGVGGGGGISNVFSGVELTLNNTILAGNLADDTDSADIRGSLPGGSNNLIGGDPILSVLGNYGGPTQTMVPLPGSPAIDRGSNAAAAGLNGDQRGFARLADDLTVPNFGSNTVDIGAAEFAKLIAPLADFNGDGRDDYATYDSVTHNLVVYLGLESGIGGGVWGEFNGFVFPTDFVTGDFNGDGRDDIAARSSGTFWFAISEGAKFQIVRAFDQWNSPLTIQWTEMLAGDFDGDGLDEVAGWWTQPGSSGRWEVLHFDEQTGASLDDGLAAWGTAMGPSQPIDQVRVGDVNRDGRDDLFGLYDGSSWYVALSLPGPDGTFVEGTNHFDTTNSDFANWFDDYLNPDDTVDFDAPYQKVLDIFSEVRNTVELEFYAGLMKGIQATAETKAGNPWDQAALLVDRLEEAGFEADIASGVVEVPVAELRDWIGIESDAPESNVALSEIILNAFDGNAVPVDAAGNDLRDPADPDNETLAVAFFTEAIRFQHAWVRATVPTVNGLESVDIDPSWKFKDRQDGQQIDLGIPSSPYTPPDFGISGRDGRGTFDELGYFADVGENQLPVEWYEDQLMQYLVTTGANASLAEIAYDGPIKAKQFARIEDALGIENFQFSTVSTYDNLDEILITPGLPEQLTHRLRLSTFLADSDEFSTTIPLSSYQQLLDYEGIDPTGGTDVTLSDSTVSSYGVQEGNSQQEYFITVDSYENLDVAQEITVVNGYPHDLHATAGFPTPYPTQGGPQQPMDGFADFIASDYVDNFEIPDPNEEDPEIRFMKAAGFSLELDPEYDFTPDTRLDFDIKQTDNPQTGGTYNPLFAVGVALYSTDATPLPLTFDYYLIDGVGGADYDDTYVVSVSPSSPDMHVSIPVGQFSSYASDRQRIHFLHSDNIIRGLREGGNQDPHDGAGTTIISNLFLRDPVPGQSQINQVGPIEDWQLELTGQSFKTSEFDYEITPNTYIEFDFLSTSEGLAHYIGVDTDTIYDNGSTTEILRSFYGSQIDVPGLPYQGYNQPGQTQRLVLPIGAYLDPLYQGTGLDIERIVFGTIDTFSNDAQAVFSHVRMFDLEPFVYDLSGDELQLVDLSYVTADADYSITPNTTIQFDFKSTNRGDQHVIGWDTNDVPNDDSGPNSSELIAFYGYTVGGSIYSGHDWKTLRIPVKDSFSGSTPVSLGNLVFGVDDGGFGGADSFFRNVKLYEGNSEITGSGSNRKITLTGDVFGRLQYNYDITPRTFLEFDFKILSEGRFHGIGWDSNDYFDPVQQHNQYYLLGGTHPGDYDNVVSLSGLQFDADGQTHHVRIPIGEHLVGSSFKSMENLVFLNDDGAVEYSNFTIGEEESSINQFWADVLVIPNPSQGKTADTIQIGYVVGTKNGLTTYRPYLEVNGIQTAAGTSDEFLYPGETVRIKTEQLYPTLFAETGVNKDFSTDYEREAGQVHAIVLDANQHSQQYLFDMASELNDQQGELLQQRLDSENISYPDAVDAIGDLLTYVGTQYWEDFDQHAEIINGYLHAIGVQPRVGSGIITADPVFITDQPVTYLNFPNVPENLGVDFLNWVFLSYYGTGEDYGRVAEAMQLIGFNGSALENALLEEAANTSSISTMRGLERAYRGELGFTDSGDLIDREAIQVFESVPNGSGRTIYFRGEIGVDATTPYDPISSSTRDRAQLLDPVSGELKNHVRPGTSIAYSQADRIVDTLEDEAGNASGLIRVFVPRSRSKLEDWVGTVYFAEYETSTGGYNGSYKIVPDTGPAANGAYGTGILRPENTKLPIGQNTNSKVTADPVNIANGNMSRDEVDFLFANRAVPLDFARHYDSQNNMDVGFGVGWTHSFTGVLYRHPDSTDDNKIVWLRGDGQRHTFERADENSEYEVPASLFGTFETVPDGGNTYYIYRENDGTQYWFESVSFDDPGIDGHVVGRLAFIAARNDDGVAISYANSSSLEVMKVEDYLEQERRIEIEYLPSSSALVERYAGNQLLDTWQYDFIVVDEGPGHTTRRLAYVTSPTDQFVAVPPIVLYQYYSDGPDARIGLISKIIEPNLESHEYEYYANGRVFRVTDGAGNQQTFSYNLFRNLTEFTDENGNVETYIHQDNGLLEREIYADRSRLTFAWGTEDSHEEFLMRSSTDEVGVEETFEYYQPSDPNYRPGELKRSISKDGIETLYEYWVSPNSDYAHISELSKITVVNPSGPDLITQFSERDERGILEEIIDPEDNVTTRKYFGYNSSTTPAHLLGRLKSETLSKGVEGDEAVTWQPIADDFEITGNTLSVRLSKSNESKVVVADAIRIDRIDGDGVFTRIVDDDRSGALAGNSPDFRLSGTASDYGVSAAGLAKYAGDATVIRNVASPGANATWLFTDLEPGTYRISALWVSGGDRDPNAYYEVFDGLPGAAAPTVITVDQTVSPSGFHSYTTTFDYSTAGNLVAAITEDLPSGRRAYDSYGNMIYDLDATGVPTVYEYDVLGRLVRSYIADSTPINFAERPPQPYLGNGGGHDVSGGAQVQDIGRTAYLYGNSWKAVDLNYEITPNTILEFDFAATTEGDAHTIAFANGNVSTSTIDAWFRLFGSVQPSASIIMDFYDYELGQGKKHYRIPVGQYLSAGSYEYLVFINNDDTSGAGDSYYSNLLFHEGTGVAETTFTYDPSGRLLSTTDALGRTTTNEYDTKGNLTKQSYADGTAVEYKYDAVGNQAGVTDELGRTTRYVYDSRNRLIQTIFPDDTITRLRYDGVGRVVASIDELGQITRFTYDEAGRLLTTERDLTYNGSAPTPVGSSNVYDSLGRLEMEIDANGNVTQYGYDKLGRVVETRVYDDDNPSLPPVFLSTTSYDANGNVEQQVVYDIVGFVADGGGTVPSFGFDSVSWIAANGDYAHVVSTSYDAFGQPVKVTNADGTETSTVYDAAGRVRFTFDELGHRTEFQYDNLGRLERVIAPDPDGTGPEESGHTRYERDAVGNVTHEWQYFGSYEGESNVEHTDQFVYDLRNRVVTTLVKDEEHRTDVLFDVAGQRVATTDALGNTSYSNYDERGQVIQQRSPDPDNNGDQIAPVTSYEYDAAGNVFRTTDPLGNSTWFGYDSLNRLRENQEYHTLIADNADTPGDTVFSSDQGAVNYVDEQYSFYGRDISYWDNPSEAPEATWTFDDLAAGSYRVAMTWPAHETYENDADVEIFINGSSVGTVAVDQSKNGDIRSVHGAYTLYWTKLADSVPVSAGDTLSVRLTGDVGEPLLADAVRLDRLVSREYTYDDNGNLLTESDSLGHTTGYAYDELDRQTSVTLPDPDGPNGMGGPFGTDLKGPITETVYDGYGNLIKTVDTRGTASVTDDRSDEFEYDQRNRLIVETLDVGSGHKNVVTTYEYDAVGNTTLVTDALGFQTHYRYDDANRLIDEYADFGEGRAAPFEFSAGEISEPYPASYEGDYQLAAGGLELTLEGNAFVYADIGSYNVTHRTVLEFDFQAENFPELAAIGYENDEETLYRYFELTGSNSYPESDQTEFRQERLPDGTVHFHIAIGQYLTEDEYKFGLPITRLSFYNEHLLSDLGPNDRPRSTFSNIRLYESDEVRTVYTYDTRGNLETIRTASDPRNITTRYKYDLVGQQTHEILDDGGPLERVYTTTYDAVGKVLVERNETADTQTTYEYDDLYRLTETTLPDPDGDPETPNSLVNSFAYDVAGNLIQRTNGVFESTHTAYNEQGLAIVDVDGNGDETFYRYDSEGNLVSVVDSEGNATTYQYDGLNRLAQEIDLFGEYRLYLYNQQGNLWRTLDRNERLREFAYDNLDRQTHEYWYYSEPEEWVLQLQWQYDNLGRVTYRQDGEDANTAVVNTYTYDGLGRLIEETNYDPNLSVGSTGRPEIRQTYEYENKFVSTPFFEKFIASTYRRQYMRTNEYGEVDVARSHYELDRLDRLSNVVDEMAGESPWLSTFVATGADYTYDTADNLNSVDRWFSYVMGQSGSMTTSFAHDDDNRLTSITHDLPTNDITHTYQYDNASRITDFDTSYGSSTTDDRGYVYDEAGQLTTATGVVGEDYTYDENGNRVTANGQTIVTNAANRLVSDGVYYYEYDREGNRTRRTEISSGIVTLYEWDHRNRLTGVETLAASATPAVDFTGVSLSQYTGQDNQSGPQPLPPSEVVIEDDGQTVHLAGNAWKRVSFGSLGLASTYAVTANTVLSFDFYTPHEPEIAGIGLDNDNTHNNPIRYLQLAGTETGSSYSGLVPDESYRGSWQHYEIRLADFSEYVGFTANRFIFVNDDDVGGNNGGESLFRNIRLTEGSPTGAATSSLAYTYDADGRRIERSLDPDGDGSEPATSEYFVYSSNPSPFGRGLGEGELSMTFVETGGSPVLKHRYLHGPSNQVLADVVFAEDSTGSIITDEVLWQLGDHQGTVRDVVDGNEVLRKHVEYDSFGDVTEEDWFAEDGSAIADPTTHAEAVDQLFYHTGQERDAETGLQKQGARWYDPAVGRWLSEDPLGFDAGDANLYRYVGNSPPNLVDPTGLRQAGNPLDNLPSVTKPFSNVDYVARAPSLQQFTNQVYSNSLDPTLSTVTRNAITTRSRSSSAAETFTQVQNAYFGELYARSPEGLARAKAQRDAEYEQYIRTGATAGEALVGELLYGVQRAEVSIKRGLAEPLNIAEDAVGFLTAGDLRARSQSLQALDARPGSTYLENVGYVGLEYAKEVGQINKVAAVYNYAVDPTLENARAVQDQGFNAALQLYGLRALTKPGAFESIDPTYRSKIVGRAQKTGTPGHQFRVYREALEAAKDPEVQAVYLNKGYNKALGLDPKTVNPNVRPDITVVYKDRRVGRVEVQSLTDRPKDLRTRNLQLDPQIRAQGYAPLQPNVVIPKTSR